MGKRDLIYLIQKSMEQKITILQGYNELVRGAYLGAIASISSADRVASAEEISYLEALCDSANLSAEQKGLIEAAAKAEMSDEELKKCLDVLKTSDLRFSLITDVIAFAQSDKSYHEDEELAVAKMATYLGVNEQQVSLLDQFTKKAVEDAPIHAEEIEKDENSSPGFLDRLGFGDKLKNAGINSNNLLKGALGIIGPILLAKMFSRRRGTGTAVPGGSGGGLLSGLTGGGLGSLLGNGGLLGGLLGGGRGFGNAGGMLGRIFGKRSW